MQTILIIEFKGFSKISTELSSRMNEVEVTPERVRAAVILLTEEILKKSLNNVPHNNQFLIGGDTFVILFDNLEIALKSATQILGEFYKSVAKQGYFYLKPCICIGSGTLK